MSADVKPALRVPLLILGFLGLVTGVAAGLARLGARVPEVAAGLSAWHGVLMTGGFFGVVISLERAVAIGRRWAYFAPLATGVGTLALIAGESAIAATTMLLGSLVLLAATVQIFSRQQAMFTFTLVVASLAWVAANGLWIRAEPTYLVAPWSLSFLILTIAGERLELSRFLPPSQPARAVFVAILAVLIVGLIGYREPWGPHAYGAALAALAMWLVKQDIARRTVRSAGLTRFIAVCLLSGYLWLGVGGGIALVAGLAPGTPAYDAALHAITLGFVFSMVFGHAPIIFPAVLRVKVPYHPTFYAPLLLLHASLLVRFGGDAAAALAWTRAGAWLNALALLAFIVGTATAVLRGRRSA